MLQQQFGHPQRHRGFADAGRAGQCHQAAQGHLPDQTAHQRIAADDRSQAGGQILLRRLQGVEHDLRDAVAVHRRDKAVTTLRHVDDIALALLAIAQRPAQRGDVHPQVDLFDHTVRPHAGDQLLLADDATGVFDQHLQNIEGAAAHAQWSIPVEDQPLAQMKGVWPEIQHRCSG